MATGVLAALGWELELPCRASGPASTVPGLGDITGWQFTVVAVSVFTGPMLAFWLLRICCCSLMTLWTFCSSIC